MGVDEGVGAGVGVGVVCVSVGEGDGNPLKSGWAGPPIGSGLAEVDDVTVISVIMAIQLAPLAPGSTKRNPSDKG